MIFIEWIAYQRQYFYKFTKVPKSGVSGSFWWYGLFAGQQHSSSDYPSPNISVGPPIHPPPHLLPYLYPHGLYPGTSGGHPLLAPGPPLSSLFTGAAAHHGGVTPSLLFNAQLALAAQHPAAFFSHAAAYSAAAGLAPHHHSHQLKAAALASGVHRFAPYTLPVAPPSLVGGSPLGSAFETVTPGTTSPSLQAVSSPPPAVPTSPDLDKRPTSPLKRTSPLTDSGSTASELKSIEKMVNGLEVKTSSHPDLLNHHHVKCEDGSKWVARGVGVLSVRWWHFLALPRNNTVILRIMKILSIN